MRHRPRGQVLVLFALSLVVLLGFAALGIDVGYMYTVRHELQRCADAGALAGASAFIEPGNAWSSNTEDPTMVLANQRAREYASKDVVVTSPLLPDNAAGEIEITFPELDHIGVKTSRTIDLFFSRLFLGPTRTVSAYAEAEAALANSSVTCLKPWGISYPWVDNNLNGQYDPGENVHDECPEGITDPSWYFCPGSLIQIKVSEHSPNETPSAQTEPSHFFALDFSQYIIENNLDCGYEVETGAKDYQDFIMARCLDTCIQLDVGTAIPIENGNMVTKTIDGAQYLIKQDPDATWEPGADHPESPLYSGESWRDSPRVFRIPIYDPRIDQLKPGAGEIHVAAFAGMWLDHVDPQQGNQGQGTVYGRYIPLATLGGATSGPGDGTPVLRILRLVK